MSTPHLWTPPIHQRANRSWQKFLAEQLQAATQNQRFMWWAMRHATDLGHLARCHVRVDGVLSHSLLCTYLPQDDLERASLYLCGIEAGERHFFSRAPLSAGLGESGSIVPIHWEQALDEYSLRSFGFATQQGSLTHRPEKAALLTTA